MQHEQTDNFFLVDDALGVVGLASSLFGGPEDKSTVGFTRYLSTAPKIVTPDVNELVRVGLAAGWPSDDINAIRQTYDQNSGTGSKGDWHFIVTSTYPQTSIKWFKGAGEQFTRTGGPSQIGNVSNSQNTPSYSASGISMNTVLIGAVVLLLAFIIIKKFS